MLENYIQMMYAKGMDRAILHSDLNNFYASVECLLHPELRGKSVVVCGSIEDRHGIVLAKNMKAKKAGVTTGMTMFEAQRLCPDLVGVEANFDTYLDYSHRVRNIYLEYTNQVEPFGIDEAWLDVTCCLRAYGSAENVAREIKERIKKEIGVTVSIGVSFNKVFAKLGSDMKKPDAITVISRENFQSLIWPLPAKELLYVGRKTAEKLQKLNICTIGDLARANRGLLEQHLGKWGGYLHTYASGQDIAPVRKYDERTEIKSVGNSMTFYKDIVNNNEAECLVYVLAESVAARMREYGFCRARTITLTIVANTLEHTTRMMKMQPPASTSKEIAEYAMVLFKKHHSWQNLVRGLGISVSDFLAQEQLCMGESVSMREKTETLEKTVEQLRNRFGRNSVLRGVVLQDAKLSSTNVKETHVIHPVSFKK